jgi:hypothetical protein
MPTLATVCGRRRVGKGVHTPPATRVSGPKGSGSGELSTTARPGHGTITDIRALRGSPKRGLRSKTDLPAVRRLPKSLSGHTHSQSAPVIGKGAPPVKRSSQPFLDGSMLRRSPHMLRSLKSRRSKGSRGETTDMNLR